LGQEIGEAKLQILSVDAERADQIANDAEKVRADLTEVTEKLHSSADVLQRTVVVAPVSGTVVDVKFKTYPRGIRPYRRMGGSPLAAGAERRRWLGGDV
jgi:HlyD family secretion protein/epimerase transport system membrane fusion protein